MIVQNKRVLVVGLARSGVAVAHALARRGAVVTVTDRKPPFDFRDVLPQLIKEKVGVELGSQRLETFLRHEIIVISPGVPWDLPQLEAARAKMIPVYPEVEAASWFVEGTLVGVTGSNGKTTTTALLGDMLKASGFSTFVGGNIGKALSSAVDHARPGTKFVTELSSFQLEGIHEFRPHVAVMLNFSPNHLDRHANLEAYAQAKRQIFRNQGGQDYAVLNADDPWVSGLQATVPSRPVFFSRRRELANGVFVSGGRVYYRVRHMERALFETRDVSLRGDFNLEDVLAATTAACLLGADFYAIRKAVRAFQAVEHRLEFVREIEGVDFYNNSKATSVDATLKSLEAFQHGVHLIMGGKDKGAPYTPLVPLIKERVREILLIGAAAPVIAAQLAGSTELVKAGDIATALYEAFARSRPGDTVLLAPACSSFDQFTNYEERGRVFKELVARLARDVAAGRVVRTPEPEFRIPDSGFRIPKSDVRRVESAVQNLESGILNIESEVRGFDSGIRNSESEVCGVESGVHGAESDVRNLESGISNLESEVRGFDSGIRNSESGIPSALSQEPGPVTHEEAPPPATLPTNEVPAVIAPLQSSEVPGGASAPLLDKEGRPEGGVGGSTPSSAALETQPETRPIAESTVEREGVPEPAPEERVSVLAPHHIELRYVFEVDAVELPRMESPVALEDEPSMVISGSTIEILDDDVLPYEARAAKGRSAVRSGRSEAQDTKAEDQGVEQGAPPAVKQPKLFKGNDQ